MNIHGEVLKMKCESCGMPLERADDYVRQDPKNKYCKYCTDENGNLKSKEKVREGMIQLRMKMTGKIRAQVEKEIDEYMKQMPAWK